MTKISSVGPVGPWRQPNAVPKKSHQRMREPVTPSKGRVVGYYSSCKNNRGIAWESQLELKACTLFEFSLSVKSYREQPIMLWLPNSNSDLSRYTPDFEITDINGEVSYVEVKPESKLQDSLVRETLLAASNALRKQGYAYYVLTERELNQQHLLRNLTVLKTSLQHKFETEELTRAIQWINLQGQSTYQDLSKYMGGPKAALALISQRLIAADLYQPLSLTTPIWPIEENDHENYLFKGRFAPDFE